MEFMDFFALPEPVVIIAIAMILQLTFD